MSQLQDNLNEILRQKNQVLIPSNVKSGVQYLGLTGTYTGDTIHDAFKVFSTVELMNADTDKVLGDRAVVLGTENIHPNENTTFSKLYLPETFTLDAKPDWLVQGVSQLMVLYNVDTDTEDDTCIVSINAAADWPDIYMYMNFEFMSIHIQLEYSSNDGITWTTNDTIQTGVKDLGGKYRFCDRTQSGTGEGWQNLMDLVFIQRNTFLGLYECKNVSNILTYQPLETQLSVITASDVTSGKTVFGANNTIVTGTMTMSQAEINMATDTSNEILNPPHTTLAEVETMFDTSSNSNVSSFVTNYLEEFNNIIYGDTSLITGDIPANSIQELVFVGGTKLDTLANGDQVPMYGTILKVRTTNLNTLLNLNMVNVEYTDGNTSHSIGGMSEWYTLYTDGDYTYVLNTLILHTYVIDTMTDYNITYFNEMM